MKFSSLIQHNFTIGCNFREKVSFCDKQWHASFMILDEMMIFSEKERRKKATKVWLPFFFVEFWRAQNHWSCSFFVPSMRWILESFSESTEKMVSFLDPESILQYIPPILKKNILKMKMSTFFFQINSKTHPFFSTRSILKSIFWGVDEIYLRSVSKVEFIWHQTKWFWVHSACKTFRYFYKTESSYLDNAWRFTLRWTNWFECGISGWTKSRRSFRKISLQRALLEYSSTVKGQMQLGCKFFNIVFYLCFSPILYTKRKSAYSRLYSMWHSFSHICQTFSSGRSWRSAHLRDWLRKKGVEIWKNECHIHFRGICELSRFIHENVLKRLQKAQNCYFQPFSEDGPSKSGE